jgi:hypothetical protein
MLLHELLYQLGFFLRCEITASTLIEFKQEILVAHAPTWEILRFMTVDTASCMFWGWGRH